MALGKGEVTRQAILRHSADVATQAGLGGLTIGQLAGDLGLSKSGLFAHFHSKVSLQLAAVDFAARQFIAIAVRPALRAAPGEPRLRALFENWLAWPEKSGFEGGCFFIGAFTEYADKPGPVRDRLVRLQREWLAVLARAVRLTIAEGHFRADVDPEQWVYEICGVILVSHHFCRLLTDPKTGERARQAFEALLERSRAPGASQRLPTNQSSA